MTIGIATRGPRAGLAAYRALQAVELLGRGAIGGFAVFVWRDDKGAVHHAETQDLGSLSMTMADGWRDARHAAIISSGPNRPEPLIQFLPAQGDVGMVTGHRLPSSRLPDGGVINQRALQRMAAGGFDEPALAALLSEGPGMDAGLICLPLTGPVLACNAPRVTGRDDVGQFIANSGAVACAILHNSIYAAELSGDGLAQALGLMALETMGQGAAPYVIATLPDRLLVVQGATEALTLDGGGKPIRLQSANPVYGDARAHITAVYSGTPILQQGAVVGRVLTEVFSALEPACLVQGAARRFLWRRNPR